MNLRRGGSEQAMAGIAAIIDNRASVETCQAPPCLVEDEIGRRDVPIMSVFRGEARVDRA